MIQLKRILIIDKGYLIVLISLLSFSCKEPKNKENIKTKYSLPSIVVALSDTLQFGKEEKGVINYTNRLDSLKKTKKDERLIFILFNLFDRDVEIEKVSQISVDTIFNETKKIGKTLSTEFKIIPKKKGDKVLAGCIYELLLLHAYGDSAEVRQIERRYYFKKEIYVK